MGNELDSVACAANLVSLKSSRIAAVCVLPLLLLLLLPLVVQAQLPESPVIIDWSPGGCFPTTEICGDGIDQDCDGSDLPCSGSDADGDGFPASVDCDDTNASIYPGVTVACSAACGQGTWTCLSSGSYSPCSCSSFCEATGSGRCYYISALTGSDSNTGTFSAPWKTLVNVSNHYQGGEPPRRTALRPGDVVYLQSGMYRDTVQVETQQMSIFIWNVHGTSDHKITFKAYPGAHPIISPAIQAMGIYILQSSHIVVGGVEISGAYDRGFLAASSEHIEVANAWIRDTDGLDNNNIAGVAALDVTNFRLHHSKIHDNFDRVNADTGGQKTENSRNIVLFGGGNVRIDHNTIFNTPPITASKTGACIAYKHGQTLAGGYFKVDNNVLRNCFFATIGTGTYGGRFHHNTIYDSDHAISVRSHGTDLNFTDNIAEFNTVIRSKGLEYIPTDALQSGWPIGSVTFRNNIVVDNSTYNLDAGGIVTIDRYGLDSTLDLVNSTNALRVDRNCYYNASNTSRFSFFAVSVPGGTQGGLYSLSQWQGLGHDNNSHVVDPNLDSTNVPQNPLCAGYGATVE